MKKKILKWFLIILLTLAVIYFIYSAITAKIYFDIYTAMYNKVNNEEDFYAKIQSEVPENTEITLEVFIKDNVAVKKLTKIDTETKHKVTLKFLQQYALENGEKDKCYLIVETPESKTIQEIIPSENIVEPENKMFRYDFAKSMVMGNGIDFTSYINSMQEYTYSKILLSVLKHPTILYSTEFNGEKCYAIRYETMSGNFLFPEGTSKTNMFLAQLQAFFAGSTEYISKETKLPIGKDVVNTTENVYSFFSKEVTEEDIALPDLSEYELLQN